MLLVQPTENSRREQNELISVGATLAVALTCGCCWTKLPRSDRGTRPAPTVAQFLNMRENESGQRKPENGRKTNHRDAERKKRKR